jgi:hypothetical protein
LNQPECDTVDTYRRFARRIGTVPGRSDAWDGDHDLPIWHLPNEKQRGFEMLYSELRRTGVSFADWEANGGLVGDYVGIPRAGPGRGDHGGIVSGDRGTSGLKRALALACYVTRAGTRRDDRAVGDRGPCDRRGSIRSGQC